MKTTIERFAPYHLGFAHEVMAHFWMSDMSARLELSERLKKAHEEFDKYLQDGTLPDWMKQK